MQPLVPAQLIVPPWCGQTTEALQVAIDLGARNGSSAGAKIAARSTSSEGETVITPGVAAAKLVAASKDTETDNRNLLNEPMHAS